MDTLDAALEFLARQDLLLLFLLLGTGALIGRIRFGGVELGAAAVLFLGMATVFLAATRGYRLVVPEALGTLGLVLFDVLSRQHVGPRLLRVATRRDTVRSSRPSGCSS